MANYQNNIPALYIHIPFCDTRCIYCDFFTLNNSKSYNINDSFSAFTKAIIKEIILYKQKYPNIKLKSVYIGGGTPSLLPIPFIKDILSAINNAFITPNKNSLPEFTIECNPNCISKDKLILYKDFNINRISLGCQSLQDNILNIIGRNTNRKEIIQKYHLIRSMDFQSVNMDLIYGLPSQTFKQYKNDLIDIIKEQPDHLSIYELTFNQHLNKNIKLYDLSTPSEISLIKQYLFTQFYTNKNNYHSYEVSNFAKYGHKSIHNSSYWEQKNYIGIGPSAVGTIQNIRYTNIADIKSYINSLLQHNKLPVANSKILKPDTILKEMIMLSLRTSKGISLSKKHTDSSWYPDFKKKVYSLVENNLLTLSHDGLNIKATPRGKILLNQVIIALI